MGGLSNWRPYGDNRPSGNSVLAGVHITEATREGFLRGGKQSFILPENFNPLPNYYHCTDLFYGMNLYRAFVELEGMLHTDPAGFVANLTDFLEREAKITPANYHKLRFLGNHDTVSWVWQAKRAVDCYGVPAAKMLFALISLIDGMPMIYQGDEDPTIYGHDTEDLTAFFTKLFGDRKELLPRGNLTEYIKTGTPVFAFIRHSQDLPDSPYATHGEGSILVLINLSGEEQPVPYMGGSTAAQSAPGTAGAADPLPGYSYRIVKL
jgi:glycosidase